MTDFYDWDSAYQLVDAYERCHFASLRYSEAEVPPKFAVNWVRDGAIHVNHHSDLDDAKLDAKNQHAQGAYCVLIQELGAIRFWKVSKKTGKILLVRDYADDNANIRL